MLLVTEKIIVGDVYRLEVCGTNFTGVCIGYNRRSGNIRLRNSIDGEGVEYLVNLKNPKLCKVSLIKGYFFSKVRKKLYYIKELKRQSKTKIKV